MTTSESIIDLCRDNSNTLKT